MLPCRVPADQWKAEPITLVFERERHYSVGTVCGASVVRDVAAGVGAGIIAAGAVQDDAAGVVVEADSIDAVSDDVAGAIVIAGSSSFVLDDAAGVLVGAVSMGGADGAAGEVGGAASASAVLDVAAEVVQGFNLTALKQVAQHASHCVEWQRYMKACSPDAYSKAAALELWKQQTKMDRDRFVAALASVRAVESTGAPAASKP